jgi:hypothetical protein
MQIYFYPFFAWSWETFLVFAEYAYKKPSAQLSGRLEIF